MKAMAGMSPHCLSASVWEAAESASRCEGGPHLEECRAAPGFVSDPRVLRLPGAPELGLAGRASHLERPSSEAECLTVCEMMRRVLGHASHVRPLFSPSNPISEFCYSRSFAVECSFAMDNKQFSNPREEFRPISLVAIGASRCIS